MGEVYTYNATHLTTVREDTVELTQCAELGQVGTGRVALDDTAGTQAIVGQKDFSATQSGCSIPLLWRGYVEERQYGRDAGLGRKPHVGAARGIAISLVDTNAMLGFDAFRTSAANRPAETVAARGAWLMSTAQMSGIANNGRCNFAAGTNMDAADYQTQYPGDVLADMALAQGGVNYHVNDYGSGPELTFRDDNVQTSDTSTLRISNVLSDDSAVTLNPFKDAALTRRPGRVYSLLGLVYAKGVQYAERAATAVTFNGRRVGIVSNSNVKTSTVADAELVTLLQQHRTEEDVIECTVLATAAQVNLMPPGWRIEAKFSHLATEGYGGFGYFSIIELTKKPIVADGGLYEVRLKLSPQEAPCAEPTFVQYLYNNEDEDDPTINGLPAYTWRLTLPAASTSGNLLGLAVMSDVSGSYDDTITSTPSGWTREVNDENTAVTVGNKHHCYFYWKKSEGEQTVDVRFNSNSGIRRFLFFEYHGPSNSVLNGAHVSNQHDNAGPGYAIAPAIAYNAGGATVMAICFMNGGPQSGDAIAAGGTGVTLRTPISSVPGNPYTYPFSGPHIALIDDTRSESDAAGTTALYPAAGGWLITFTGTEAWLVVGMTFTCS